MEIIGHRGARGLAAENTTVGIQHALDLNILDWIEFDVRHTRDGALVVLHGPLNLRGSRSLSPLVRHQRYKQLAHRPLHGKPPVPTFAEVVTTIGKRTKINIEIKTARSIPQVITQIEKLVAQGYSYDHFLVSSFFPHMLRRVQRRNPRIRLGLLLAYWSFAFMAVSPELKLSAVGFYRRFAHRRAIAVAKRRGLFTYAYTVNHIEEAKRLQRKGIDAIVTDYPDRMVSLRHRR